MSTQESWTEKLPAAAEVTDIAAIFALLLCTGRGYVEFQISI